MGDRLFAEFIFGSKIQLYWLLTVLLCFSGCATSSNISRRQAQQPRGFWEKITDELTERECNVGRFICPYGFGPAGEPCECADPSGVVVIGRTVK
jgi:hypothetical protein